MDDISQSVEKVKEITSGSLDILVNNAGVVTREAAATETPFPEARALFDVNFWGVLAMNEAYLPLLLKSKPGGVIVHIGSVGALCPTPFSAIYNASKAALHHYANTLRIEVAPLGISVVVVAAGTVKTNIHQSAVYALPEKSLYKEAEPGVVKGYKDMQGGEN
jgi:1-acylglycerone phosphate reductase